MYGPARYPTHRRLLFSDRIPAKRDFCSNEQKSVGLLIGKRTRRRQNRGNVPKGVVRPMSVRLPYNASVGNQVGYQGFADRPSAGGELQGFRYRPYLLLCIGFLFRLRLPRFAVSSARNGNKKSASAAACELCPPTWKTIEDKIRAFSGNGESPFTYESIIPYVCSFVNTFMKRFP